VADVDGQVVGMVQAALVEPMADVAQQLLRPLACRRLMVKLPAVRRLTGVRVSANSCYVRPK